MVLFRLGLGAAAAAAAGGTTGTPAAGVAVAAVYCVARAPRRGVRQHGRRHIVYAGASRSRATWSALVDGRDRDHCRKGPATVSAYHLRVQPPAHVEVGQDRHLDGHGVAPSKRPSRWARSEILRTAFWPHKIPILVTDSEHGIFCSCNRPV